MFTEKVRIDSRFEEATKAVDRAYVPELLESIELDARELIYLLERKDAA